VAFAQTQVNINVQLGEFYFLSKKYREAIPLFEAAYQINPANYANGYDLALAYRESGDFARACEQVKRMLAKTDKAEWHSQPADGNSTKMNC